jgi:hypothetical protein
LQSRCCDTTLSLNPDTSIENANSGKMKFFGDISSSRRKAILSEKLFISEFRCVPDSLSALSYSSKAEIGGADGFAIEKF